MSYEYGGSLYASESAARRACVADWLTAGGAHRSRPEGTLEDLAWDAASCGWEWVGGDAPDEDEIALAVDACWPTPGSMRVVVDTGWDCAIRVIASDRDVAAMLVRDYGASRADRATVYWTRGAPAGGVCVACGTEDGVGVIGCDDVPRRVWDLLISADA